MAKFSLMRNNKFYKFSNNFKSNQKVNRKTKELIKDTLSGKQKTLKTYADIIGIKQMNVCHYSTHWTVCPFWCGGTPHLC